MGDLYKETVNKRKVTMFSYPRSGSNWMAYCLEQVTGLVVIGSDGHIGDISVVNRLKNDPKAVVHKVHGGFNVWSVFDESNGNKEGLLLVIRNYKESILRDSQNKNLSDMKPFLVGIGNTSVNPDYMKMIQKYDEFEGPKILMDYDDFILNTEDELKRLALWLVQFGGRYDDDTLAKFIDNIKDHKEFSMKRYIRMHGTTATDGDPQKLKIQKETWLNDSSEKKIDEYVESRDPKIYEKYLKRYKL
tara:strand:- start:1245 stop:1982 length:738 start_codon:yes stop_codon:yes gene_type:complete